MAYTLGDAARATGKSKPTIAKAIKRGQISAVKAEDGSYQIDPAELHRVYPMASSEGGNSLHQDTSSAPAEVTGELELLRSQAAEYRETIRDLRVRLDASEAERRHESEEHRRVQERLTGLLTHRQAGSVPSVTPQARRPWWRRWFR